MSGIGSLLSTILVAAAAAEADGFSPPPGTRRERAKAPEPRTARGHRVQVWVDGRRRSCGVYPTRAEAEALLEGALDALEEAPVRRAAGASR